MTDDDILFIDKEPMSPEQRKLFCDDVKRIAEEYFILSTPLSVDIAVSDRTFSVCVLFGADSIRKCKKLLP